MKVVLDVNVWVSALLWGGLPIKILSLSQQNKLSFNILPIDSFDKTT